MGLMFPKTKDTKKRKKHHESILQKKDGRCYLCMELHDDDSFHADLHAHHIFGGPNRDISEEYGLKVYLCPGHHLYGPEAVHVNKQIMEMLHKTGQEAFEQTHTRDEFMQKFGRNYL